MFEFIQKTTKTLEQFEFIFKAKQEKTARKTGLNWQSSASYNKRLKIEILKYFVSTYSTGTFTKDKPIGSLECVSSTWCILRSNSCNKGLNIDSMLEY